MTPSLVRHFSLLRTSSAYRKEKQTVLISGNKLITELSASFSIINLLVSDFSKICHIKTQKSLYQINKDSFYKIMGMHSSSPLIAEIALPVFSDLSLLDRILFLDNLQDPGNVGTLIRTAYAFGFNGVYCVGGGVDLFNDKVIRASSGAVFMLPYAVGAWKDAPLKGRSLYCADMKGRKFLEVAPPKKVGLILGNEGQGLSQEAKNSATPISVDQLPTIDSLNVSIAGGILLHHFRGV